MSGEVVGEPVVLVAQRIEARVERGDAVGEPVRAELAGLEGVLISHDGPLGLARRLGVNPKTFRAWLRGQAAADNPLVASHEHYGRWWITEAEARQLAEQYRRRC